VSQAKSFGEEARLKSYHYHKIMDEIAGYGAVDDKAVDKRGLDAGADAYINLTPDQLPSEAYETEDGAVVTPQQLREGEAITAARGATVRALRVGNTRDPRDPSQREVNEQYNRDASETARESLRRIQRGDYDGIKASPGGGLTNSGWESIEPWTPGGDPSHPEDPTSQAATKSITELSLDEWETKQKQEKALKQASGFLKMLAREKAFGDAHRTEAHKHCVALADLLGSLEGSQPGEGDLDGLSRLLDDYAVYEPGEQGEKRHKDFHPPSFRPSDSGPDEVEVGAERRRGLTMGGGEDDRGRYYNVHHSETGETSRHYENEPGDMFLVRPFVADRSHESDMRDVYHVARGVPRGTQDFLSGVELPHAGEDFNHQLLADALEESGDTETAARARREPAEARLIAETLRQRSPQPGQEEKDFPHGVPGVGERVHLRQGNESVENFDAAYEPDVLAQMRQERDHNNESAYDRELRNYLQGQEGVYQGNVPAYRADIRGGIMASGQSHTVRLNEEPPYDDYEVTLDDWDQGVITRPDRPKSMARTGRKSISDIAQSLEQMDTELVSLTGQLELLTKAL
jgi:hypothetical protein